MKPLSDRTLGILLALFGAGVVVWGLSGHRTAESMIGVVMLLAGVAFAMGGRLSKVSVPGVVVDLEKKVEEATVVATRTLTSEQLARRRSYASVKHIPGKNALPFNVIVDSVEYKEFPWAKATTPAYVLDANFRILDWNEAFRLAFDNTMEGRKGQSVLEWVYFLENWRDAIDKGERDFADSDDPDDLPWVHVEPLVFESRRYGRISATKRAFRVPEDDEKGVRGWLALLELAFDDLSREQRYLGDLSKALGIERMWDDYARSYDPVLTRTKVYPQLIEELLGIDEESALGEIEDGVRALDLGAGTGNLTKRLLDRRPESVIFAVEKNETMLDQLRNKCSAQIRTDDQGPGVIPIKQDIRSLFGLADDLVDVVFSSNVLYGLSDEDALMAAQEALRVLRSGGELRVCTPTDQTDLDLLFDRIRSELEEAACFDELESSFYHVYGINKAVLEPMPGFHRATKQTCALLSKAGFSEVEVVSEDVYGGQAAILRAVKP